MDNEMNADGGRVLMMHKVLTPFFSFWLVEKSDGDSLMDATSVSAGEVR